MSILVGKDYSKYPLYRFFVRVPEETGDEDDYELANFFTLYQTPYYKDEAISNNITPSERDNRLAMFYNILYNLYGDQIENVLLFNTILYYISEDAYDNSYFSPSDKYSKPEHYKDYIPDVNYWNPNFLAQVLSVDYGRQPDEIYKFLLAIQLGFDFAAEHVDWHMLTINERKLIINICPEYREFLNVPMYLLTNEVTKFVKDNEGNITVITPKNIHNYNLSNFDDKYMKDKILSGKYSIYMNNAGQIVAFSKAI